MLPPRLQLPERVSRDELKYFVPRVRRNAQRNRGAFTKASKWTTDQGGGDWKSCLQIATRYPRLGVWRPTLDGRQTCAASVINS
jgi:hypothetical protein